jgi:hypothetical protein
LLAAVLATVSTRPCRSDVTTLSGADYANECRNNGVPTPPDWGDSRWISRGLQNTVFISAGLQAEVFTYSSALPEGMCIALPRYDSTNSIRLLGIICLGKVSGKACFWDNQTGGAQFFPQKGDAVPFSRFGGGADLTNSNAGVCTSCHAGENPYIIHPGTPLGSLRGLGLPTFPDQWYRPIVRSGWPQNAGPQATSGACTSCHTLGGQGGRFPKLSTAIDGYCGTILPRAISRTMPPGNPGDPGYAMHAAALQAMCNSSPSPLLRVDNTLIDFGDVELGFSFAKALVVHNDGDAGLTFSVAGTSPINGAVWPEVTTVSNATIAPGDPAMTLRDVFQPQATGPQTIQLQLSSAALPSPQPITLTGRGISPIPLDTTLVMDRSGSMRDPVGDRRKIDVLQVAANLYSDLLRDDVGGSGTGDKLGFVRYNQASDTYMTLDFINPSKRTEVQNKLSAAAIADIARLAPSGETGIGGGMQTGAAMMLGIPASRKQALVVLTDGIENRLPYIADVKDAIRAANPNLRMYSIGLGTNVEATKLQGITNVGNGYHQVSDNLAGVSLFDLETFYFKIFVNASGMDLVVDPTHVVNLADPNPVVVDTARIVTSDRSVTFLVLDDAALRNFYDLEFLSPRGDVIRPGVSIGGIPIQESQRHTYKVYRIIFPDVAMKDSYVGDWVLRLKPNGKWSRDNVKRAMAESNIHYSTFVDPFDAVVPIGFGAAVASDYKLNVALSPDRYLPGADVLMTAALTDRGWPAPDGRVDVTVTSPGGVTRQVSLYDNGTHGDIDAGDGTWTNHFVQTVQPNVYKFLFKSSGRNDRGELTPREATRYVTLKEPEPTPCHVCGNECPACAPQ